MKKGKSIKIIIGVILIVFSSIFSYLFFNKMVNMSAGNWTGNEVDLMNKLYKYNCSIDFQEENGKVRHFITNEKCPFEIEYLDNVSYNDTYFNYYLDKVNDNGNGNKDYFTYKINGKLMSEESTGVTYYKFMSYNNGKILYLSTLKSLKDNANEIINSIGFKYRLTINFEYIIIPVLLYVIGIIFLVSSTKNKKTKKGRKM